MIRRLTALALVCVSLPIVDALPLVAQERLPAERMLESWINNAAQSADDCTECGECEAKCPYQSPIREMIAENIAFYESAMSRG